MNKKETDSKEPERLSVLVAGATKASFEHQDRNVVLAKGLEDGTLYEKNEEVEWKCLNCGYVHKGKMPPDKCPLCQKPKGWYMEIGLLR